MVIRLYRFAKRPNSTKLPSGSGETLQCEVFEPCSVTSPTIIIAGEDPTGYNYAYISKWERYYFIQDWVYRDGRWFLSLMVDVLGSWRGDIMASSQYVSRSASSGNIGIQDDVFPTYAHPSTVVQNEPSPWETGSAGTYVAGILGGSGETSFYALTQNRLDALISYIFSDAYADRIFGSEAWAEVYPELKTQINPLQYISSLIWYPIDIGGSNHPIKVGWVNTNVSGNVISPKTLVTIPTLTLRVPNHPQGAAWSYLNAPPYSEYYLYYPPFGLVPLDSEAMMMSSEITASVTIDPIAGKGFLVVEANGRVILRTESNVGQQVQLGQITAPGMGIGTIIQGVAGAVSGGAAIVGSLAQPGISGAAGAVSATANLVSNTVEAFRSVAQSKIPSTSTMGSSSGGYPSLVGDVQMISVFMPVVGKDVAHKGSPLCAVTSLASVSGYTEIYWPHLDIPASAGEIATIYSHMERGFYLE